MTVNPSSNHDLAATCAWLDFRIAVNQQLLCKSPFFILYEMMVSIAIILCLCHKCVLGVYEVDDEFLYFTGLQIKSTGTQGVIPKGTGTWVRRYPGLQVVAVMKWDLKVLREGMSTFCTECHQRTGCSRLYFPKVISTMSHSHALIMWLGHSSHREVWGGASIFPPLDMRLTLWFLSSNRIEQKWCLS